MKDVVLVHTDEYAKWVLSPDHPTQGRRFMIAKEMLVDECKKEFFEMEIVEPIVMSGDDTSWVIQNHSREYLANVRKGECDEWDGVRPDLGALAFTMLNGTITALNQLLHGKTLVAVNFAGAKHHAQYDHSSGFCVLADFAISAHLATQYGHRVAIFDCDVHHGDGTENLTRNNPDILSYSVHQRDIFPFTGDHSIPSKNVYNYPLYEGEGDKALHRATRDFLILIDDFKPTMVFVACGADGLADDPLGGLKYTTEGYSQAMRLIRTTHPNMPILFGGAGGYLPDDQTPATWVRAVSTLINPLF